MEMDTNDWSSSSFINVFKRRYDWVYSQRINVRMFKSRRIAMREINPDTVLMSCKKVTAETEIYQGRKKILKVLESE